MKKLLLLALLASCGGERPNKENPPPPPAGRAMALAALPTPRFTVGQGVKTTQAAYIRSSPFHGNTSSNVLATAPVGATGTIMGGPVLDTSSDGDRWSRWDVAFAGTLPRGWVADTYLVATTVPPPPPPLVVTTVTVQPATASVLVGATVSLTATARDQNGAVMAGQSFTWASTAPSIASVSSGGGVTGLAAGSATIRATDAGKSGQALVTVTALPPPPAVAGITVSPVSASIRLGEVQVLRFSATVFDASGAVMAKPVVWSSGTVGVATIDTAGWITTVSLGSALITATIGTVHASGQVTIMARAPLPFNGVYADVRLRNGRIMILRQDSAGVKRIYTFARDTTSDSFGAFGGAAFFVRPSTVSGYATAMRQLAVDLGNVTDTVRFQTSNSLATTNVYCAKSGCWIVASTPGHATWTSTSLISAAGLVGLAHALEAAARGDSVFAPGDSLPYVRAF